jgi:uncharacterized protein YodC (DUF2158 family)
MTFKVGDTVQLKSGGPAMTVTRIGTSGGEPMIWCAWFEGTKDAYGLFPPDALKAAEPHKAPPATQPAEADSTLVTPEPVEASQSRHSTEVDSAPPPEGDEKSEEAQIASIQSLIAGLLKRS